MTLSTVQSSPGARQSWQVALQGPRIGFLVYDILIYWSNGVLVYWFTGVLVYSACHPQNVATILPIRIEYLKLVFLLTQASLLVTMF